MLKTLGKIDNAILYGLTYPTANRWRQTLVNTFLDSWKNIFYQVTNFTKSLIKTLTPVTLTYSVTPACQT